MKKALLFLVLFSTCLVSIQAQYGVRTVSNQVKTVRLLYWYVQDGTTRPEQLVRPYLVMGSEGVIGENGDAYGRTLEISFDELSHETKQYTYTLCHLNADGSASELQSYEYVDGFTTQSINDYEHSLNTSQLYTHYRFTFPNDEMRIKASGNYAIKVYEDNDEDRVVAWVYFSVVKPTVTITGQIRTNTDIEISGRYQQLDLDLLLPSSSLAEDYFICVRQNGRYDNQVLRPRPSYIGSQRVQYLHCKELIFEGGNEYRHFDTYSTYFAGAHVHQIRHDHSDYHAFLEADEVLDAVYMHEYDVNGQYLINAERTVNDIETEAEYMWVHWILKAQEPWWDGLLYVGGDLFENALDGANRMQYDAEHQCYYLDALVKQGGHDYQYWFVPKGEKKATLLRTEGSHWETGNEYTIYVYYKPFGSRYDQLVGIQLL